MYKRTLLAALIAPSMTFAQTNDTETTNAAIGSPDVEEVVIFGRAIRQVGSADAASEGSVGGADLAIRPLLQVAELMEAVPGMVAVQHSGSGKANQYFMRGFNLDHGTDFTNYIDDMPINFRSHGHGQGYLDVNGLIPEVVDRIDYRKGTYRAESGDFAIAGASYMHTIDTLEDSFVSLEGGSYNFQRLAAGGTVDVGSGTLTTIAQYKTYDGPWELEEDLDHKSIWTKYVQETDRGLLRVSLSGYSADWNPTEQIPEYAIGTAVCEDEFCSLDDTAEGKTDRLITTMQLDNENWHTSLYAQYYDWEMSSDPTYNEQINQFDRRWTIGGKVERNVQLSSDSITASVGTEFRYDDIGRVGVELFEDGEFFAPNGENEVKEGSVGIYSEINWAVTDQLRLIPGVRAEYYNFDVIDLNGLSEDGQENDTILLPKLAAAYAFTDNIEAYANWGRGFHSNDARGVVNEDDPVDGLVAGTGYEFGLRYERPGLNLSATLWELELDSELIFVGDSNSVEPKGGSERDGIEFVGFWSPVDWLAIDAVYAISDARFNDGSYVEGAVEDSGQIGVTVNYGEWDITSRLRYLGEYPITDDNIERTDSVSTLNLRLARAMGDFSIYGEVINLTDDDGKDIVYFYESRVDGLGLTEDQAGRVSRTKEPRTYRLGLRYNF